MRSGGRSLRAQLLGIALVSVIASACSTSPSELRQVVDAGPQLSAAATAAAIPTAAAVRTAAAVPAVASVPSIAPAAVPTEAPRPSTAARGVEVQTMEDQDMDMYPTMPIATPTPTNWNALPVAASDPANLAKQLAFVDAALHDPKVTGAELLYMGHLQQLATSRLVDYPEWKDSVLAALPEHARAMLLGTLEAGKQLRSMGNYTPRFLPDWRIAEPAPSDELLSYYKEAEAQFGVPWAYLAAINLVETRMGRIRGLSSAGAQGPMQFMPATWNYYGRGDINSNHDAIMSAARYLSASGAPGNMQKALFAYNHSQGYVNALIAYARVMLADPASFRGYYGWQVYYPTPDGPALLPVGWVKQ